LYSSFNCSASSSTSSNEQKVVERRSKLVLLSDMVFTVLSRGPALLHVRHVTPLFDIELDIELVLPKYVISPPHLLHSCVLLSILLTLPSFFNLLIREFADAVSQCSKPRTNSPSSTMQRWWTEENDTGSVTDKAAAAAAERRVGACWFGEAKNEK
jgi:hypothetical protein